MLFPPRFLSLLGALLTLLGAHSVAEVIPFSDRDDLLWLKVAVPGRSEPLHFLLDSGASATVLDLQTARALGMPLGNPITVRGVHSRATAYRWNDFSGRVGGLALSREVIAVDLSHVSRQCHQRIDGLVGADFFRGRIVQVDYAAKVVRVFPRCRAPAFTGTPVRVAIRNDVMCVPVSCDGGSERWTRLDTGCDSDLHWVAGSGGKAAGRAASIAARPGARGSVATEVNLGPERVARVKATLHPAPIFPGESGLVGNGILSRFTVTFDRDGKRLLLARR